LPDPESSYAASARARRGGGRGVFGVTRSVRTRHSRDRRRHVSGANLRLRWIVLLAALLAFSWQSVVAETHRHVPGEAISGPLTARQGQQAQSADSRTPADAPATCPICRELAHANHYLPPTPFAFSAPRAPVELRPATVPVAWAVHRSAHDWRSRAPPLPLQA
jgi:hypothetical protein